MQRRLHATAASPFAPAFARWPAAPAPAPKPAKKKKNNFNFLQPQNTSHVAPTAHRGSVRFTWWHRGIQNPFPLTPIFLNRFPQPCFPQPCFPRTCLLHQLFPQSTSLSLLPSTFLHAFPYHLSLSTSQPANLFALLNLREFTRIIYRPTLATLWDLNLLTPFRSCSSDKNETNG
jgi:hypothetical protein